MALRALNLAGFPTYNKTSTTRFLRRLRAKFALAGDAQINLIYFISIIKTLYSDSVIKALKSNTRTLAILNNPVTSNDNVATI